MSGSKHADQYFRARRIAGVSEADALSALFSSGVMRATDGRDFPNMAAVMAPMLYRRSRGAGLSHGEALDEVLMAGYEYGREGVSVIDA